MIVNFLLFQFGWLASVLAAAHDTPWWGVLAVTIVVTIHLVTRGTPGEIRIIGVAVALGLVMDSFLLHANLVVYRSPTPPAWLAPGWIVAMWANFATTLRHSMSWLRGRMIWSGVLGAVFGPLAYWGAARLGAVQFTHPVAASVALALVWGFALPALGWISVVLETAAERRDDPLRR